jgi:hypothetical protein
VAAVREAAWMLAFADLVDHDVRTEGERYDVPDDIAIERPLGSGRSYSIRCGCGWSSGATHWSWMRDKGGRLEGQVSGAYRKPRGASSAEAHALELLDVAEDGFEEGCAPKGPPARVAWDVPGAAVGGGSAATLDEGSLEPVRNALALARPSARCARNP